MDANGKAHYLTQEECKIIKGVAIILMLMNHLWFFTDRIPGTLKYLFSIQGESLLLILGCFGEICVSTFFFLSGYGSGIKYADKPYNVLSKVKRTYFGYWKVFLIFIPIGFLFFSHQDIYCADAYVCRIYANFNIVECILNFVAFISTYNREWWFLRYYLILIILFVPIRALVRKMSAINCIAVVVFIELCLVMINGFFITELWPHGNEINYHMISMLCFPIGVIAAKNHLLDKLSRLIVKLPVKWLITIILTIAIIFLRDYVFGTIVDIVVVPVMIVFWKSSFPDIALIRRALLMLGEHSMNIWLLHSFFCYYYEAVSKSILFFAYGVPALLVLIVYSFGASVLVNRFWELVGKLKLIKGSVSQDQ